MPTVPLDRWLPDSGDRSALERLLVRAEVVYNGIGSPREDGAVVLIRRSTSRRDVRETAVGGADDDLAPAVVDILGGDEAAGRYAQLPAAPSVFAVSPAVVNAHTHLDLNDMELTPGPYVEFIRSVIAFARAGGRGLAAAKRGVAELKASGTTVIGDIVTDPAVMALLLADRELTGVAYWEVIAPDPATADAVFDSTREIVGRFRALERPGGMRVGLSPHTPHTVSRDLLVKLVAWAASEGLPVAIHVAESGAERQLHLTGDGSLAAELKAVGFAYPETGGPIACGASPVAYLERIGVLKHRPTLVHMVHVDETDVRLVQKHGSSVVHCPRSNGLLECGRFPWALYARHGVEVAFGTDSRGSSPDLDVTSEVRHAAHLHGSEANRGALVRGAVKAGHRALGMRPPQVRRGDSAARLTVWT